MLNLRLAIIAFKQIVQIPIEANIFLVALFVIGQISRSLFLFFAQKCKYSAKSSTFLIAEWVNFLLP